jgi:hypothetical protein
MAKILRKRNKEIVVLMYAIAMHIYPYITSSRHIHYLLFLGLTLEYEHDPSFSRDGPGGSSWSIEDA